MSEIIPVEARQRKRDWQNLVISRVQGLNLAFDSESLQDGQTVVAKNVVVKQGALERDFGLRTFLDAVTGTPRWVHRLELQAGGTETYLITDTNVYRRVSGAWSSIASGLSGDKDHPVHAVTVPFADAVVFTNGVDNVKEIDGNANTVADVANLPSSGNTKCVSVALFDNSLFLLSTTEGGASKPQRVRWSDAGSISVWSGNDSGFIDLYDASDAVMNAAKIGPYLSIYRTRSIVRCIAENSATRRFDFRTVVTAEGIFSTHGVLNIKDQHIVVGARNVYLYDGGFQLQPIGDPIFEKFLHPNGRLEESFRDKLFCAFDFIRNRAMIFYPDAFGEYPNRVFVFDMDWKEWTERDFGIQLTGWGDTIDSEVLTWDDLAGTWLDQSFKWGTTVTSPEKPNLVLCPTTNTLFEYTPEAADDNGTAIESVIETKDFGHPHNQSRIDSLTVKALGGSTTVMYSTDGGKNWIEYGTLALDVDIRNHTIYKQLLFRKIRFRFTSSVFLRLVSFNMRFRTEFEF